MLRSKSEYEWQGTQVILCGHEAFGNALAPYSLGILILHQWKMKGLTV